MNKRQRYPSDLTDEQWALVEPLIPAAKEGGRERTTDMHEVLNGVFYILVGGASWRMMPHDLPNWKTVYHYFREWRRNGTWARMNDVLREKVRVAEGRQATPSAGSIDSQSVKTRKKGGVRGWDGGKKINGRKRHIIVDTLGLVLRAFVTEANYTDREVASWLIPLLTTCFPRRKKLWADGIYRGAEFIADMHDQAGIDVEIVERDPTVKGFKLLPYRWVVERTFAWLSGYRRFSRDYELLVKTSDAMIYAAMTHLMLRRLAPVR